MRLKKPEKDGGKLLNPIFAFCGLGDVHHRKPLVIQHRMGDDQLVECVFGILNEEGRTKRTMWATIRNFAFHMLGWMWIDEFRKIISRNRGVEYVLSANLVIKRLVRRGASKTNLWLTVSFLSHLTRRRASAVMPEIATPIWLSISKIFFWWEANSERERCKEQRTACVFDFTPTLAVPIFTVSIAYSTWWTRPSGLHKVTLSSYWFLYMSTEEWLQKSHCSPLSLVRPWIFQGSQQNLLAFTTPLSLKSFKNEHTWTKTRIQMV